MDELRNEFERWLLPIGLQVSDEQWEQFVRYFHELLDWNERMNLTAITGRNDVFEKHFFDSITLASYISFSGEQHIADIGSGAGFPGIPLKIMFPELRLTIIDSLKKRITFLEHLVDTLQLSSVHCIHGRAEDMARQDGHRDRYDVVTARAVARLNVLNELCLPFVRDGGTFVAMKGSQGLDEVDEAKRSLSELNAVLDRVESFQLPTEEARRTIILVRKVGNTPKKYPRKPGVPTKVPL